MKHGIHIPNPCNESWKEMSPLEKGRFCDSCQKSVVDFVSMSDEEVIDYLVGINRVNICGRLEQRQLTRINRSLKPVRPKRKWMFAAVVGGLLTTLTLPNAYSQEEILHNQHIDAPVSSPDSSVDENEKLSFVAHGEIKGRILDEKGEPFEGVVIRIPSLNIQTYSNDSGEYTLVIPQTEEKAIIFELLFIGMETIEYSISVTQEDFYVSIPDISIAEENYILTGDIVVTGWRFSPRSLWWKVKGLFRKRY